MSVVIIRGNAHVSDVSVTIKGNVDIEVIRDGGRWVMEIAYEDAVSVHKALTEYIDWVDAHPVSNKP